MAADVALIALTLAGILAAYVPPRTLWVLQVPAVVLPVLGAAVAMVSVVHALRRRWAWLAVHLACVLLIALRVDLLPWGAPPVGEGETLTLVTLNASAFSEGPNGSSAGALGAALREASPDVVAWQEAPLLVRFDGDELHDLRGPLLRAARELGQPFLVPAEPVPGDQVGQPVTTSLRALGHTIFALVPDGNPSGASGVRVGGGTRTVLRVGRRDVALYNVHLRSFDRSPDRSFGRSNDARRQAASGGAWLDPRTWVDWARALRAGFLAQEREAVALRHLLDAERLPYVVAGDFNSTPDSWAYRHVARGLRDLGARAPWGRRATFPSPLPVLRIDFVLASHAWEGAAAWTLPTTASDHRPLATRIVLRGPRTVAEPESVAGAVGSVLP